MSEWIDWQPDTLRRLTFGPGRFYNYAPCAIQDAGSPLKLWWCRNEQDGIVRDEIVTGESVPSRYRGRIPSPQPALRHATPGSWDSFHVCDPSVIAGKFALRGRPYGWALLYLGNDVDASRHNQIGVAFADSPSGPWQRADGPLIGDDDTAAWGVGQPSAIGGRHTLLFYTRGDHTGTRILVQQIDLSDAGSPNRLRGPAIPLPREGLLQTDGKPSVFHNADFALHPTTGRLFVVREQHPHPADAPRFIGASVQIASIALGDALRGRGAWTAHGEIGPAQTGLARCHNAGFIRDARGWLPDPGRIGVIFSSSDAGGGNGRPEWTYNLWRIDGLLRGGSGR